MIGVAAGLALEGYRAVAHSYTPFLVERPYEQIKLDLGHNDLGAVLVSTGASYDARRPAGRTRRPPTSRSLSALPGWTIDVPGHPDELERAFAQALAGDDRVYIRMTRSRTRRRVDGDARERHSQRLGGRAVRAGRRADARRRRSRRRRSSTCRSRTSRRVRPFDADGLAKAVTGTDVVLVEPYLAGTSSAEVARALADRPVRLLALGVQNVELRRYGTARDHRAAHGLDAVGIRRSLEAFLR